MWVRMMRFKKPWQAILWEELSVSGSITLALVIVEVWIALLIHIAFPDWKFDVLELDNVTYFLPGLNALLLMLIRGNKGELRGGFQRRLLFFPTHVISVVSIIIFSRLLLTLLHTFILRSICIYLFAIPFEVTYGNWKYVYSTREMILDNMTYINLSADGSLYLLLQFLFWVFHWSKQIFTIVVAVIIFLILRVDIDIFLYGKANILWLEITRGLPIYIRSVVIDKPVGFLLFSTLLIWHLSMIVVKLYRHNLLSYFSFSPLISRLWGKKEKPDKLKGFKSRYSALLCYEFSYGGFSLLKVTFLFWILIGIGYSLISKNDTIFSLLSFDLKSLFKYYTSWTNKEYVFLRAPYVALGLSIIYYWLRFSFKYGPAHSKYAGLVRFLPVDNFERVNAYLLVLSVNVVLIASFLVLCEISLFLIDFYWGQYYASLLYYEVRNVFFEGGYGGYIVLGELLLSLIARSMFVALVTFALVASKEVLPTLALYLLLYGTISSIVIYGDYYEGVISNPLGDLCKEFSFWLLPLDRFLDPAFANYLFLFLILAASFLYLIVKNRLLKRRDLSYLILIFLLTFVSIYPWNFVYGEWESTLFQVKLYAFLAILVVLPYLSCFLAFQNFKWRSGLKQVISTLGTGKDIDWGFFWKTKIPLLMMMGFVFIFHIDPGYLTQYGIGGELNSIKLSWSSEELVEGNKLNWKFIELVQKCKEVIKASKQKRNSYVVLHPDYDYKDSDKYWLNIIMREFENKRRIPSYVYSAMIDFYNGCGIEVSYYVREFLKDSENYSEEGKKCFRNLNYSAKWRDTSFISDLMLLELYLRGMSEDYEGMLDSLKVIKEFGYLVNWGDLPSYNYSPRINGFVSWYLSYTEVPIQVIDEFLRLVGNFTELSYEDSYKSFRITSLMEINRLMQSSVDYWYTKIFEEFDKFGRRRYYYHREDLFSQVRNSLDMFSSRFKKIEIMYYPLFDLITLWRVTQRNDKVLSFLCRDYEWRKFLERGYLEKPTEDRLNLPPRITVSIFDDLTYLGLAVEKFRIKYGKLPKSLDQLVPEFVGFLPCDPYNRRLDFGYKELKPLGFVIYSFGPDFEDDGGFSSSTLYKGYSRSGRFYLSSKEPTSDYVFMIPPLMFRQHGFTEGPYSSFEGRKPPIY